MQLSGSVSVLAGLVLLLVPTRGSGQTPAAPNAQREVAEQTVRPLLRAPTDSVRLRSQTTKARDGATDAGSEFGEQQIVQRRAHVEPWSVVADTQLFYTDNVALTPTNEQRDWYLRYGLAVAYTNRIQGPLFIDLSLQQYLFRYSEFDLLDFDLTRFDGGVLVQAPWLANSFFFTRYLFTRITEPWQGATVFTSHTLDVGIQKVWKISRGQQVFAGGDANLSLSTDPEISARHEYSVTLGYSARLTEHLTASLSYRGSWNDYTGYDRRDWNHILALGLTYELLDWLRIGANVSYSDNDSNIGFADYRNTLTGCSISLRLVF